MSEDKLKKYIREAEIPPKLLPENICIMLQAQPKKKKSNIKCISRSVAALAACLLIVASAAKFAPERSSSDKLLNSSSDNESKGNKDSTESAYFMNHAESYEEIYTQLKKNYKNERAKSVFSDIIGNILGSNKRYNDMELDAVYEGSTSGVASFAENGAETVVPTVQSSNEAPDHSETITQSENVDEADMIKTDGKNIYYTVDSRMYWLSVENGNFNETVYYDIADDAALVHEEGNYSIDIRGMYLTDGKLSVLFTDYSTNETYLNIYNTSDNGLSLITTYSQDGDCTDSRMINGNIYIITNTMSQSVEYIDDKDAIDLYIPSYCCNGKKEYVEPGGIYLPGEWNNSYYMSYAVIGSVDINDSEDQLEVTAFADYSGSVYCTENNLYLTSAKFEDSTQYTVISRVSLDNGTVTPSVSGEVKGTVLNQFSMDEYNGYFRIATTSSDYSDDIMYDEIETLVPVSPSSQTNNLFVLNENLETVGTLTGYGSTESIKSVNFQGDTAYVVTYRQTDPLYAINLSDPASPTITDEFKIQGFSTFLHKWNDGLLLGFGIDADENGINTGVKATMFGTDENLTEQDTYSISDPSHNSYISSEGAFDRKALLIDSKKNIIGFPVSEYNYTNDEYEHIDQYYEVLKYEDDGFVQLGRIYSDANNNYFMRALYIDDYIYAFSFKNAVSCNINDFNDQKMIELPFSNLLY